MAGQDTVHTSDAVPESGRNTSSMKEGSTLPAEADIDLYSGVGHSAEDHAAGQINGTVSAARQHSAAEEVAQPSTSQPAAQARPTLAAQSSSHVTAGAAVYIGNLQWWTTDADLESLCSKYGQILSLKTFEDKTTGKSKGYVLVHFAAPDAAVACQAELNGQDIQGKACVVTAAQTSGSRDVSTTSAPTASTSGRITPPVRPAAGRGTLQRQPVNGQIQNRPAFRPQVSLEQQQFHGPPTSFPIMGMGNGMGMGGMGMNMGMMHPMGMAPMNMPAMAMGPMGMPMSLMPGMFQPPPPPRDSDRRRQRDDFSMLDGGYKRTRY